MALQENTTSNLVENANRTEFVLFNATTARLMITLCLISFLINVTIISLFLIDPLNSLRRPSGYLVANLNVVALLTGFSSLLTAIRSTADMTLHVFFTIFSVAATASLSFIFVLSCERYVLVTAPIKYRQMVTLRRVQIVAGAVWIWSGAIGVPLYWIITQYATNAGYLWINLPFGISLVILIAIDVKTFAEIRKINSTIREVTESETGRNSQAIKNRVNMQSKFALVVVLLLLNFIFFVCPLLVFQMYTVNTFNHNCEHCLFKKISDDKYYATCIVLFIFHDINTALFYIVLIPKYRMSFIAICKKCFARERVCSGPVIRCC